MPTTRPSGPIEIQEGGRVPPAPAVPSTITIPGPDQSVHHLADHDWNVPGALGHPRAALVRTVDSASRTDGKKRNEQSRPTLLKIIDK